MQLVIALARAALLSGFVLLLLFLYTFQSQLFVLDSAFALSVNILLTSRNVCGNSGFCRRILERKRHVYYSHLCKNHAIWLSRWEKIVYHASKQPG